jgi:carboxyl-terminal processing protease
MRERDLVGHIKSPQENGLKAAEPKKDGPDETAPDNQIKSAIDILKSWEIFKKAIK